jgi:lambda family phage portal protein
MNILGFNISRKTEKAPRPNYRNFDAARVDNLTQDWLSTDGPADLVSRASLEMLRKRARDAERNNPYVEALLSEFESNVVGQHGFTVKPMPRRADSRYKGSLAPAIDTQAAEKIANWWAHFSQRGQYDATGQLSRPEAERMIVRSCVRDGGGIARLADGYPNNDTRFAVQYIEIEALDPAYTDRAKGISMSVEHDEWYRPIQYHLKEQRRDGMNWQTERRAFSADDILHIHRPHRFSATQSPSWLAPILLSLRHLSQYEMAEVIAARIQAEKIGFYEETGEGEYTGEEDEEGNIKAPSAPGQWERLPAGVKAHALDPAHPNSAYPDFRKAILRQICAAFPANYNIIAQDLEGVSFSSIRQGVLSERDQWRVLQNFFIGAHTAPIYRRALKMALTAGQIEGISERDFERCAHAEFAGRNWHWVDPLKDIKARQEEIALGVNSRQRVAREAGEPDFGKLVDENEDDVGKMEAAGLPTANGMAQAQSADPVEED